MAPGHGVVSESDSDEGETHPTDKVGAISEGERPWNMGWLVFTGVGNFVG